MHDGPEAQHCRATLLFHLHCELETKSLLAKAGPRPPGFEFLSGLPLVARSGANICTLQGVRVRGLLIAVFQSSSGLLLTLDYTDCIHGNLGLCRCWQ